MRDPVIIAGFFAAVILLAAVLAPVLFHGSRAMVGWIESSGLTDRPVFGYLHHHVGKADFTRVFNRAVLVAGLLCLWPAVRLLRIGRGEFGLAPDPFGPGHLAIGFVFGAGILLSMGAVYLGTDLFVWKKSFAWSKAIRESLLRATGAGVVEELVFRGALLGLMLRACRPMPALIFVTTVFAAVHFLQAPPALVIRENVEWSTGFWLAGEILRHFANTRFLLAEFATLWVAGFLLGSMRLRTRSLWLPIGLHAGWVFGIGLFAAVARASRPVSRDQFLPWIGETLKSGLVPLAALSITGALLALLIRPAAPRAD